MLRLKTNSWLRLLSEFVVEVRFEPGTVSEPLRHYATLALKGKKVEEPDIAEREASLPDREQATAPGIYLFNVPLRIFKDVGGN